MAYWLVLQYRRDNAAAFDALVALEERLTRTLSDHAVVDGHDIGSGEANIFVVTDSPDATFKRIQWLVSDPPGLGPVVAAYRADGSETYTVLWPPGYAADFKVV
jgi:hypothetical protein